MIILFIVPFIFSTQNSFNSSFKEIYLEIDDMECTYNEEIIENINSFTPLCFINCTFESIKTEYDGGAISVQSKYEYQEKFFFDSCIFNNCQSQRGGAIYLDLEEKNIAEFNNCNFNNCQSSNGGAIYFLLGKNSSIEIIISQFTNCRATGSQGGSIYATSIGKGKFDLRNCTIKSNSISSAIFIEKINFTIQDCNFSDNNCNNDALPSVINSRNSDGSIENSTIFKNINRKDDFTVWRGTVVYGAIGLSDTNCIFKECLFSNNAILVGYRTAQGAALSVWNSNFILEKCNFTNNYLYKEKHLDYNDHLYGGAINIKNSFCSINECLIDSNYVNCNGISSHGGALYYEGTNCNFTNCNFLNNYALSGNDKSYGGVGILIRSNCKFECCLFEYNYGKSNRDSSYGGVFYFDYSDSEFTNCLIKNNGMSIVNTGNGGFIYSKSDASKTISFENCTILNIFVYSNKITYGGSFYIINTNVNFIDVFFINNTVSSHVLIACGGLIYNEGSRGNFENCTFFNNSAEINIIAFPSPDDEPRSLGGALHLIRCTYIFNECKFENNFCSGFSIKFDSTSYGGGIYAVDSNISISKSDFINQTLYNNGNRFDFECGMEGGACYFLNSTACLTMCHFFNNTATLNASKISKYFGANVLGGAIYSSKKNLTCEECTFLNNYVKVNQLKEKEFGGSIYLSQGKLINCSFFNNIGYNGGDIAYEQTEKSFLDINNCIFIENEYIKQDVKSIIHIQDSFGSSNETENMFINNKFVIKINTVLFDGDIERKNENETEKCEIKFNFNQNCISPFKEQILKSDEIIIFNEKEIEITSLESVFELQCDESELPTFPINPTEQIEPTIESTETEPIQITNKPTEIQTEPIQITTEPIVTQTEQLKTPTETNEIQTEPIQTTIEPTVTKTEQLKTPTETTEIQTEPIQTTTEPIVTKTEQPKTPTKSTVTQTELIKTTTEPTEIQTELVKMPTESHIQQTNIKTEPTKKTFRDIGISYGQLIGIICGISSILLTIIIILVIILIVKKRKKNDGQYSDFLVNKTESSNHDKESIVADDNQSISTVNSNDYFEILI